jgi:hypothetical protein
MAFVAIGFEHSIANMFFIPTGMLAGAVFVGGIYWYLYAPANLSSKSDHISIEAAVVPLVKKLEPEIEEVVIDNTARLEHSSASSIESKV